MIKREIHYADHLEALVAEMLDRNDIDFVHESEDKELHLDFYLPDYDVYIEVKQFHSDRILKQLASQDNVIVIQGMKSLNFLRFHL